MTQQTVQVNKGGIGFVGLLTIVFITLKLTGFITWSWWWVLSPIWISFSVWAVILGILLVFAYVHSTNVKTGRFDH